MTDKITDFQNLARLLNPGQLITNPVDLLTYEVDAANYHGLPDAVVFPHSIEQLRQIVQWASENNIPLVARGAGTGLSGGAVAECGGLIVEFSHLDRLLEFDACGRSVVVEPGMVNLKLDEYVRQFGYYFPPDPASGRSATIGGNVAENAGGPHCFKYGVTTNYITGMEVLLSNGNVVRLGGRAVDYPEYDFCGLLTGSEGTLGLIVSVSFRLLRYPPAVKTMMAAFDSVQAAGEAVSAIIARGLIPATMEFMDQKMMGIVEAYANAGLPVQAGAALIIEIDGFPESLSSQMQEIVSILRQHTTWKIRVAQTVEERNRIWYGRKSAAGAMARLSPAYYLLDGTVPRSKLASTLNAINLVCDALGLRVGYVFHAGDGNLHPFILIDDPSDKKLIERVHQAGQQVMEICLQHDGSLTGEHGVGIEKRKFMPMMHSPAELSAMRDIKSVFDPNNLFNPGKVLPEENGNMAKLIPTDLQSLNPFQLSPASDKEAVEIINACLSTEQSLRLCGSGTKSALLPPADLTLSTKNLQGIHTCALEDLYVEVGSGTHLGDLQAELALQGVWVPLISPWQESTLGGIIATNFNAPLRMRYGSLRDLLLAVNVVLPDGRSIQAGRPVVKNVAGYDLPKLFTGSYGTLGLITDVILKLAPLPRARECLIAPLDNLKHGLELAHQLLPVCLNTSALLLLHGVDGLSTAPYLLIYTVEGLAEDVATELAEARSVLMAGGAIGLLQIDAPTGSEAWAEWLGAAAELGNSLLRLGVAPKDLPSFIDKQTVALGDAAFIADIASGLLYAHNPCDLSALGAAARQMDGYTLLLAASHPLPENTAPWGFAPQSIELMRQFKSCWDPRGLFNPGGFLV